MEQRQRLRCKYADRLECFIAIATDGGCRHRTEHYKDSECNVDYCNRIRKHNAYCKPVKGQEQ